MSTRTKKVAPEVTEEVVPETTPEVVPETAPVVPRIPKIFGPTVEALKAAAETQGWPRFYIYPSKNRHGFWLLAGVDEYPTYDFIPVVMFLNDMTDEVDVTCGPREERHVWHTTKASAKWFRHCPDHR